MTLLRGPNSKEKKLRNLPIDRVLHIVLVAIYVGPKVATTKAAPSIFWVKGPLLRACKKGFQGIKI